MKILLSGGAGFIGSHVADALLQQGHTVHVIDDLSGGVRSNVPVGAVFHEMDIRSPALADLWARERFEVLVHHAAQMDVRRSVQDPAFDADVNVKGFLNLMEAGRRNGLQKVVFASTGGAIYGEPEYVPQDEHHPIRPLSPYGITKKVTELYLYYYQQIHGVSYVALRYGNIYGPRQNPHGEAGVVAIFIQRMLEGKQPVINGDGLQTRDYVYVEDVVRANLAALEWEGSALINIGTGVETDVNVLFRTVRRELNSPAEEIHVEGKAGEQRRSVLSNAQARTLLGWEPRVGIEEGLQRTVRWFQDRHHSEPGRIG